MAPLKGFCWDAFSKWAVKALRDLCCTVYVIVASSCKHKKALLCSRWTGLTGRDWTAKWVNRQAEPRVMQVVESCLSAQPIYREANSQPKALRTCLVQDMFGTGQGPLAYPSCPYRMFLLRATRVFFTSQRVPTTPFLHSQPLLVFRCFACSLH